MKEPLLESPPDPIGLLMLLARFGGHVVSSNDLDPMEIRQARESNRMFVADEGFGFVWEPLFDEIFPTKPSDIELYERCYPIDVDVPDKLTKRMERLINLGLTGKQNNIN